MEYSGETNGTSKLITEGNSNLMLLYFEGETGDVKSVFQKYFR